MQSRTTVLSSLLRHIPWQRFQRLAWEHGAAQMVRSLSCKDQLVAMIFAQLTGATGLEGIVQGLRSHARQLYHLGVRPPAKTTLRDANADRPAEMYVALFQLLLAQAHPQLREQVAECLLLIDSSTLPLSRHSHWARFSAGMHGAKMHIVYDPDGACPVYLQVTPARVNDITAAKQMPIQPGATYVFDLGYYDYGWWAALDAADCRFASRLKSNTPLHALEERTLPADQPQILSDRTGLLPARLANARRNPFHKRVREIQVRLDTGKVLRIVSNDLTTPAAEIAALYKRRWLIELFFRWVKQVLRIRHFFGRSENAVRTQVAIALITFLLLRLAYQGQRAVTDMLTFTRLVSLNLMHRRALEALPHPEPPPRPSDPRQSQFAWV